MTPPSEPGGEAKAWWKRWWVIALGVFVLLIVISAATGGGDEDTTEAADEAETTTSPTLADELTAVEVAETLEAAGLPLSYDITDTSNVDVAEPSKAELGITSTAVTATDDADLWVTVYASAAELEADLVRMAANVESARDDDEMAQLLDEMVDYEGEAVCSTIHVQIVTDEGIPADRLAAEVQALLETNYGPC